MSTAKTIETKIWSGINDIRNQAIIDKEITDIENFIPKTSVVKDTESRDDEKMITDDMITDLMNINYRTQNVLEIIINQTTMINFLNLKFKTTDMEIITWDFYKLHLQWILDTSKFITTKFNIYVAPVSTTEIERSSYKFCVLKEKCTDVYGNPFGQSSGSKPCRCSGDHYVHNKIVRDLTCLISVLDSNPDNMHSNLRIGLTTLNFIIRHMKQELEIFPYYLKDNNPSFDVNKFYVNKEKGKSDSRYSNTKRVDSRRVDSRHTNSRTSHYNQQAKPISSTAKKCNSAFACLNDSDSEESI